MRSIKVEAFYRAPPHKVWRTITEPELIAKWLMPNDFRAESGATCTFRSKPIGGWDGVAHCRILEIDPPRRLVYTWKSNLIDTIVTFELEPHGEGTLLRFEHSGFTGRGDFWTRLFMGMGWRSMIKKQIPKLAGTL